MTSLKQPTLLKATLVLAIFTMFVYTWMFSQTGNLKDLPSAIQHFHRKISLMIKPETQRHQDQRKQADWQWVIVAEYYFNIYSAYYIIGRSPEEVLVIGTARTFTNESVFCRIYFNDDVDDDGYNQIEDEPPTAFSDQIQIQIPPKYIQYPGTVQTMEEHWNTLYAGVFVRCPFSGNVKPEVVSILLPNQTEPSNMIRIQSKNDLRMAGADQYDYKFSLCVHPIYEYDETLHLIEWIEFYKMMGVEQITLYNVSIGPDASCILHDLMEGSDPLIKMNVFPWHNNPIKNLSYIRSTKCAECALSAGSNDCLYRHRGISKYMIFLDLDEFIMPRETIAKNYSQLIDYLDATEPEEDIGQYLFRNGFFVRQRPDDPILLDKCSSFRIDPVKYKVCKGLFMMTKVWREKEYQSYTQRTKYIIKPEAVNQTGTHHAIQLEPGYTTLNVSENIAFLRHYRFYSHFGPDIEIDRVPQEFGNELVNNVANKVEYLSRKCNISFSVPVPSYLSNITFSLDANLPGR